MSEESAQQEKHKFSHQKTASLGPWRKFARRDSHTGKRNRCFRLFVFGCIIFLAIAMGIGIYSLITFIRRSYVPSTVGPTVQISSNSRSRTSVGQTSTFKSNISHNTKWEKNGFTVAGGNGEGNGLNQLHWPYDIYLDDDQTIYIADYGNNRIVEWKSGANISRVLAGDNGKGNETNQVYSPSALVVDKKTNNFFICEYKNRRVARWSRQNSTNGQIIIPNIDCHGLALDNNGYLYVSNWKKNEVRRWKMNDFNGTLVAGGNGSGNGLNQLNFPFDIFVDEDDSLYVSDCHNHRVMKWVVDAREGIVVAGGQGQGEGLTQLTYPHGLIVDHLGTIYIADHVNHRIVRWPKGATEGNIVVGGNGQGGQANQLYAPEALLFDRQGNLYVVDRENSRVQRFNISTS